jgi:beta-glucosidase
MDRHKSAEWRANALVKAMTQGQKLHMLVEGLPPWYTFWGTAGHVSAVPELCIPALVLSDAGSGLAGLQVGATLFPSGIAQASTWDPVTQRAIGRAIGAEAHDKAINVVLGPDVNMARTPYGGRNFEASGEDPYLTARTAVAFIKGIQDNPVLASVKHYALNDQETDRNTGDVEADERTTREIYLPPFEAAVKEAHVGSVMCAYNRLGKRFACQNPRMLTGILRKDWGFDGFVESDWGATHSTVPSVRAGMDLEMGTNNFYSEDSLEKALADRQITERQVDTMVANIVRPMFQHGLFDHPVTPGLQAYVSQASTPQHRALAQHAAAEATVMLKNRHRLLPLPTGGGHTIAVIGYAANPVGALSSVAGSGSSHPLAAEVVSPLKGITAQALAHGDRVIYTEGDTAADAALAAKLADYVVVVANDNRGEGSDKTDLNPQPGLCVTNACTTLPLDQQQMISAAVAANPKTVVVLDIGGPVKMPWLARAGAVLVPWYSGSKDGDALASVLYGEEEPGGRLPQTFPVNEKQAHYSPAQFPGVNGTVHYSEKLLVGYRWYDATHRRPLFPFGFGLGYTTFDFSDLQVHKTAGRTARVTFQVHNAGARRGAAVPQIYVSFPKQAGEPPKQLKGFDKITVAPGGTATVTISLNKRSFSYWKNSSNRWTIAPGIYKIMLGKSERNIEAVTRLRWGREASRPHRKNPR